MATISPEDVLSRLVEAVEVIAATGKSEGPRAVLAAWPEYRRKISTRRRCHSPAHISRADEAITWFSMIDDQDSRRALQFEVMCKAGAGKFSRICDRFGWKRTTVVSRNRATLRKLASSLEKR